MRIDVHEPLPVRQALVLLICCVLGLVVIALSMHYYVVPYLNKSTSQMIQRRQQIDQQIQDNSLRAACDADPRAMQSDPACTKFRKRQ